MNTKQVAAFAELGALFRGLQVESFADSGKANKISDPEILQDLQLTLEEGLGRVDRVYDVTFDGEETFKGKADQKISLGKSKVFTFTISSDQVYYKPVNSADVMQYAESDEGWAAMVEFAAKGKGSRAGKKLSCKPGNYQCGGRCQSDSRGCPSQMSPEQKKAHQAALRKAKKSTSTSTPTNEADSMLPALKTSKASKPKTATVQAKNPENPIEKEFAIAKNLKSAADLNKAMVKGEISPDVALMQAKKLGASTSKEVESFLLNATPDEIKAIKTGQKQKAGTPEVEDNSNGQGLKQKLDSQPDPKKELGSAAEFRSKPKIKSKEDFDAEFDSIYSKIESEVYPQHGGLIPIVSIRRAMEGRLAPDQFDDFIKQKVQEGYTLIGGEAAGNNFYSTRDIITNGITTALGGVRFYVKKD